MKKKENKKGKYEGKEIAVIRIRGLTGVRRDIKETLEMLRLRRKYACVVLKGTPSVLGMINKAKDYVTWGPIDDKTKKLLIEKRGKKFKDKDGKEKLKPFFRLSPPRKGFERKGTKVSFKIGGALGDRGEKINELVERMV